MRVTKLFIPALLALTAIGSAQDNAVKGQEALKGINGDFGTTYTLKSEMNFTLLSAKYSLAPQNSYEPIYADAETKILYLTIAVKNASKDDMFVNFDSLFTVVDSDNQTYNAYAPMLKSQQAKGVSLNLRPSQGVGQPALNDPLTVAFKIPAKAKLDKIMINSGRLNKPDEQVIRYILAPPPTDPTTSTAKNFISPLPIESRDASDIWGATLLPESKGVAGTFQPSGVFLVRLDSVASPDGATYRGSPPDEGKRLVIVTVTGKHMLDTEWGVFYLIGGDNPTFEITDTDGERYKPTGYNKPKAEEDPDHSYKRDDEYAIRIYFVVPKAAKLRHLIIGSGGSTKYGFDDPESIKPTTTGKK